MENTVKYEDWINTETFEVKSLPEGAVIKGIGWVKIPDDAEFAVSIGDVFEFRKGNSWWSCVSDSWQGGCCGYEDFLIGSCKIVWERKTTEGVKEQPLPNKHSDEFIEQRTKIFSKYLQEVKLVEWINKETFEVKSLPVNHGMYSCELLKIPEDAEFAVSDGANLEFRKGNSWWSSCADQWVVGNWNKSDYLNNDYHIVWERKTTEVMKEQLQCITYTQFIEDRTEVFKKLLQGVKFQYRYNDAGQWHNLTDKSIGHFMKPNVTVREKPQKPVIDGIEMDKEAAIKYIQKHY